MKSEDCLKRDVRNAEEDFKWREKVAVREKLKGITDEVIVLCFHGV